MKRIYLFVLLLSLSLLTSCATLVSGGGGNITIDSNYKLPVDVVTERDCYKGVTLPHKVWIPSSQLDGSPVIVKSESSEERIFVNSKVNPWLLGNIIIGGLPGIAVDFISGAYKCPGRTYYYIEFKADEKDEN